MKFFLLDVGVTKECIYNLEIKNQNKLNFDVMIKKLNLKDLKVLLHKDEDIFFSTHDVEYYNCYSLEEWIRELDCYKNSIVVISLKRLAKTLKHKSKKYIFLVLEGISLVLNLKFIVYELSK